MYTTDAVGKNNQEPLNEYSSNKCIPEVNYAWQTKSDPSWKKYTEIHIENIKYQLLLRI